MYKPSADLNPKLVKDSFLECSNWSVLFDLRWAFFKNVSYNWTAEKIEETIQSNNEIAFIYYHYDNSAPFLLVGFDFKTSEENLQNILKEENQITNWSDIIENILNYDWSIIDLDKDVLIWNIVYQQCVAAWLDCMSWGVVALLPKTWYATALNKDFYLTLNEDRRRFEKNFQRMGDWDKMNPQSGLFDIRFVFWYEENYFKK